MSTHLSLLISRSPMTARLIPLPSEQTPHDVDFALKLYHP